MDRLVSGISHVSMLSIVCMLFVQQLLKCSFRVHTEPGKPGNLEIGHFYKNQGKPGIVRELFIIFIQVMEKSEKTKYLVYISFSLTIGIVVRKVVALSVVSKCGLYHLA